MTELWGPWPLKPTWVRRPFGALGTSPEQRLATTPRDVAKMEERARLLAEQPDLRRRIDTAPLRALIDYVTFNCHPQCSIARDEAIAGSDIDGGLVVLNGPVSSKIQLVFINELRRQGFRACHPLETQEAIERYNTAVAEKIDYRSEAFEGLLRQKLDRERDIIQFIEQSELGALPGDGMINDIYLAGFSIE